MKKLLVLLYVGLLCSLSACETVLPVDVSESEEWGITLNAVASPDTTFWAYVTHNYPNSEAPNYAYSDEYIAEHHWESASYRDYYHSMIIGQHRSDLTLGNKAYDIIKEATLTAAKVELTVNDETTYPMVYDSLMLCYQSNYTPAIGDRLEVRISNAAGGQTIARTEVPRPQKIEIVEVETELLENEQLLDDVIAINRGYVRMKLRLYDPAGEKNYYRLAIRGLHHIRDTYYQIWDFYLSSDPIFRDERLVSEWGAWPAFFSDVFDDSLINGDSYEFEVRTYVLGYRSGNLPIYEVSLQSITEDYYRYLKSMQLYRITRADTYSEGVYIHSNNEGGWGLLGGISGEVHRIDPFKDKRE